MNVKKVATISGVVVLFVPRSRVLGGLSLGRLIRHPTSAATGNVGQSKPAAGASYKIGDAVELSRRGGAVQGTVRVSDAHYATEPGQEFLQPSERAGG